MNRDRSVTPKTRVGRWMTHIGRGVVLVGGITCLLLALGSTPAVFAQVPPEPPTPIVPGLDGATEGSSDQATLNLTVPDLQGTGSGNTVVVLLLLTVLSIAPSLLILLTSFTRIVIVFSLARQALGAPTLPPNQVVVGLSLMLSLVVMAPVLSEMNEVALQPLLSEEITAVEALRAAEPPIREFMLDNTRDHEMNVMRSISGVSADVAVRDTPLVTVASAFVLSELRTAFTIGFLIFIPFLIIDLVVASVLMSLGLMFLPPTYVSLPLKLLLFVLLGGWTLIAETLVRSFL